MAEETLYQILSKSEVFSFSRSETFRDTLYALQARDLIETDSLGLTIKGRYDPQVQNVLNSISDQLYYRNAIYEFLTESTCPIRNDVLRYRLSKELNCTTPNDAKAYLRQTIIAGKDVTSDVIAEAKLKKGMLMIAFWPELNIVENVDTKNHMNGFQVSQPNRERRILMR